MTKQEALKQADKLIEQEDVYVFDVCANYGQIFDNIKQTRVLRNLVATELMEENNG